MRYGNTFVEISNDDSIYTKIWKKNLKISEIEDVKYLNQWSESMRRKSEDKKQENNI